MEKELLIEFVKWLRSEYQIEDVYEMFADEFLQDRAKVIAVQPDVIKSVCDCETPMHKFGTADLDSCINCGKPIK